MRVRPPCPPACLPACCLARPPARATSPRRRDCRVLFVAGVSVTAPLSTSIYISGARCPMASGEPIRWQIRCQLGGSCLETVAASLPPQFKFRTWRRRPGRSSGPAARRLSAPHRTAAPAPERRRATARRPATIAPIYRSIDRSAELPGWGRGGAGGGGGPNGARAPLIPPWTSFRFGLVWWFFSRYLISPPPLPRFGFPRVFGERNVAMRARSHARCGGWASPP